MVEPVSLLAGAMSSDAFTRAMNGLLASRGETRNLLRGVRIRAEFRLPRRRYLRWLSRERNWNLIVMDDPAAQDELIDDLVRELLRRPRLRWRRLAESDLRRRAEVLVAATVEGLVESLEPSRAVAVAGARVRRDLANVGSDVRRLFGAEQHQRALSAMPPPVAPLVGRLLDDARPEGQVLVDLFAGGRAAAPPLAALLDVRPLWLEQATAGPWLALGEFADAHGQHLVAAGFFEGAAALAPDRGAVLLRAAVSAAHGDDLARVHDLVAQAVRVGASPELVTLVTAAVNNNPDAAADLELDQVSDRAWSCGLFLGVLSAARGRAAAIPVAERALDLHPTASGLRLALATLLVGLFQDTPQRAPRNAVHDARRLAAEVRDQRRAWGGNSAQAVLVACQASMLADDAEDVLRLGRRPPDGEATEEEATNPDVARVVAHAAAETADMDTLRHVLAAVGDGFDKHLLTGLLFHMEGGETQAEVAEYRQALATATNSGERMHALHALAGVDALPDDALGSPALSDQDRAILTAVRAGGRREFQRAIEALRPWANAAPAITQLLANLYVSNGERLVGARTLLDGARRFSAARLAHDAAGVLFVGGDPVGADAAAEEALAMGGLPPGDVKRLRMLRIQIASDQRDWAAVQARAIEAHHQLPADSDIRWAYVQALFNQQEFQPAWTELNRPPAMTPDSPLRAQAVAKLASLHLTGAGLSRRLLDMVDQYPGDEDVTLAAILGFVGRDHSGVPDSDAQRWQQLIGQFLADHPEHPAFRAVHMPDDPDEMLRVLREELAPGATEREQTKRMVAACRVPYGLLSASAGKPYVVALLHRAAGMLPVGAGTQQLKSIELDAARVAVDGAVVVDTSTLVVAGYVPSLWTKMRALFETVHFTAEARADVAAGHLHFSQPMTDVIGWDPVHDQLRMEAVDPAVLTELRRQAGAVLAAVDSLDVVAHTLTSEEFGAAPYSADGRFTPWISGLDLAMVRGVAFLSDDSVLRDLARGLNVPTFGTEALISILVESGRATVEEARTWRRQLREQYCVDLSFNSAELSELAEAQQWRPSSVAGALARGSAWADPLAALRFWRHALGESADDVHAVAGWANAGIVGFGTGRQPGQVLVFAQATVFQCLGLVEVNPDNFSLLLTAARDACDQLGVSGLLEVVTADMTARLAPDVPPDIAAQAVLNLTSAMSPTDRIRILGTLLGSSN